eukprot:TRINITY_DN496_c0_g2_i3.p2 TRINITY_DN496_c0_g2~~TRINITY_DN496_c0_g2_i3.p2  ORF type:complete len:184 (+),score=15.28 TRINITY_DN496_c0_g2_i3:690-1241(+)
MSFWTMEESRRHVKAIGGKDRIVAMCDKFYEKFFADSHVAQFVDDTTEPHGQRLGLWIAEKLTGQRSWSLLRSAAARTMSHEKSWSCPKRQEKDMGKRFGLADCRTWMRLFFWAAREEGLDRHEGFFSYLFAFIQSFVAVYERTAPPFAKESADWSLDLNNIESYIRNGRNMGEDVLSFSHDR